MIQDMVGVETYTVGSQGLLHAQRSKVFFEKFHRIFCTPDNVPVIGCLSCGRLHQIDDELYSSATPEQQVMMKQYCLGEIVSQPCDEASLDIVQSQAQQYIGDLATDTNMQEMSREINQALLDFSKEKGRRHIHER